MPDPILYDAVTLRHFAIVDRLDVLELRHGARPEPRWTEAVQTEIRKGQEVGEAECATIMATAWLGDPLILPSAHQEDLMRVWIGLNDGRRPPSDHLGEAESICAAEFLPCAFATDDGPAFDFARNRLDPTRVMDTVDILRDAVAMGDMTAAEGASIATAIRAAGRHLRAVHPDPLTPADF